MLTYLSEHERLAFSIITHYELSRGLKAKQATSEKEQVIEMPPDTFGFFGVSTFLVRAIANPSPRA